MRVEVDKPRTPEEEIQARFDSLSESIEEAMTRCKNSLSSAKNNIFSFVVTLIFAQSVLLIIGDSKFFSYIFSIDIDSERYNMIIRFIFNMLTIIIFLVLVIATIRILRAYRRFDEARDELSELTQLSRKLLGSLASLGQHNRSFSEKFTEIALLRDVFEVKEKFRLKRAGKFIETSGLFHFVIRSVMS